MNNLVAKYRRAELVVRGANRPWHQSAAQIGADRRNDTFRLVMDRFERA